MAKRNNIIYEILNKISFVLLLYILLTINFDSINRIDKCSYFN